MDVELWMWIAFVAFIAVMLARDPWRQSGARRRRPRSGACAADLPRFTPPSRSSRAELLLEGDAIMDAVARWELDEDAAAALELHPDLVDTGDTEDGEGICLEWTAARRQLAARRPQLPSAHWCSSNGASSHSSRPERQPGIAPGRALPRARRSLTSSTRRSSPGFARGLRPTFRRAPRRGPGRQR